MQVILGVSKKSAEELFDAIKRGVRFRDYDEIFIHFNRNANNRQINRWSNDIEDIAEAHDDEKFVFNTIKLISNMGIYPFKSRILSLEKR